MRSSHWPSGWIALIACALGATGCGSGDNDTSSSVSAQTATRPATTATAAGPAAKPKVTSTHFAATDDAGDTADVELTVGTPVQADSVGNPAVESCASVMQGDGTTLERSAAIPIKVVLRLTSESPVDVRVGQLDGMREVFDGQAYGVATGQLLNPDMPSSVSYSKPLYWATTHTTGPECDRASDGDDDVWSSSTGRSVQPYSGFNNQSWLIVPDQATPAAPRLTSEDSAVNWFLLRPDVSFGDSDADVRARKSPFTVRCLQTSDESDARFVAVNPRVAVNARGCERG